MISLKFMLIIIIFNNFSNYAIYLIKIFGLKYLKIDLNTIFKTLILSIENSILIKPIYNKLVE